MQEQYNLSTTVTMDVTSSPDFPLKLEGVRMNGKQGDILLTVYEWRELVKLVQAHGTRWLDSISDD